MGKSKEVQKMLEEEFGFSLTMNSGDGKWISGVIPHEFSKRLPPMYHLNYNISVDTETEVVKLTRHVRGLTMLNSEFVGITDIERIANMLIDFEYVLESVYNVRRQARLYRSSEVRPLWVP